MSEQTTPTIPSSNFFKRHLGWIITGLLTLLFWMQTCNLKHQIREGKEQITQLELDKQELTSRVNKQGKTIFQQDAIITDNTTALNKLTDSIFNLKRKNAETVAYFKNRTATILPPIHIPYLDTLAMKAFEDSMTKLYPELAHLIQDSVIKVPQKTEVTNPHYNIIATARKKGITIDSLFIPDQLDLRFLETKGNLFRSPKVEVQFKHTNPYVHTTSANSAFYRPKRASFLKRVLLPVAVGVGAGILISK